MKIGTPHHRDGSCQSVRDALVLVANGHWRDPQQLPESTWTHIEHHLSTCPPCAAAVARARQAAAEAAGWAPVLRAGCRRGLAMPEAGRQALTRLIAHHSRAALPTEADEAWDRMVRASCHRHAALPAATRQTLQAVIAEHRRSAATPAATAPGSQEPALAAVEAPVLVSVGAPEPAPAPAPVTPARPAAAAAAEFGTGMPAGRIGGPSPRWVVPLAAAAAVLIAMMIGLESQSSMAEDAVSATQDLRLNWRVNNGANYDELVDLLAKIQSHERSSFFCLLPDVNESPARLRIAGATNEIQIGGREAVTIAYVCSTTNARSFLHAMRLGKGEELPKLLGVPAEAVVVNDEQGGGTYWHFTIHDTLGVAWQDHELGIGYLLVGPDVPPTELARTARCLRQPSRRVTLAGE